MEDEAREEDCGIVDACAGSGAGRRSKRLYIKVKSNANVLPHPTLPLSQNPSDMALELPDAAPHHPKVNKDSEPTAVDSPLPLRIAKLRTPVNPFGLYKIFRLHGSKDIPHDPDNSTVPEDHRDQPALPAEKPSTKRRSKKLTADPRSELYPFPNISSYRLGEWYWSDDGGKSRHSFQTLVGILGSEEFDPAEVRDANWAQIDALLARSGYDIDDMDTKEWIDDGISWKSISVTLNVPFSKSTDNPGNHPFTVEGFHYRPLVPIIREKLESSAGREYFHTLGHELRWNPGPGKEHVRVYGEMYTSPAFLQAYEDLQVSLSSLYCASADERYQKSPPEPDCSLPRHIVGLMFASDSTMLAAFGTAKLWPLYMFYANDSKYKRAKPTEQLFETVAYFEKVRSPSVH